MAETFYSALGVEPGADGEAVERAYRERVKESHPDVTDDPDAPREFARLTVARDVLVADEERDRYDRLGHAAYVRAHVDASPWTAEESVADADTSATADDETSAAADSSATAGPDATATSTDERTAEQSGERRRGGGGVTAGGWQERTASERSDAAGQSTAAATPGGPGTATDRGRRSRRQRGTAAAYHRVDTEDTASRERDPLWRRAVAVGRRVGPWALVHLVLVASAVATAGFGYAGATHLDMNLPALVVAVVVLVVTLLASAAHLLSRAYA